MRTRQFLASSSASFLSAWAFVSVSSSLLAVSASSQVIGTECHVTQIRMSNGLWVAGSEVVTCSPVFGRSASVSDFERALQDSCGRGNPCPTFGDEDRPVSTQLTECLVEQNSERGRDLAADISRDTIVDQPDANEFEYAGNIYTNAFGVSRAGSINTIGEARSVYPRNDARPGETLSGMVHQHPVSGVAFPSTNDMQHAADVINLGLASIDNYSLYVVGRNSDGVLGTMAEFDAVDFLRYNPRTKKYEVALGVEDIRYPNVDELADAAGVCRVQ